MRAFLDFKYTYPCQYCGECPNWLGYSNEAIDDIELVKACVHSDCPIFGRKVKDYE